MSRTQYTKTFDKKESSLKREKLFKETQGNARARNARQRCGPGAAPSQFSTREPMRRAVVGRSGHWHGAGWGKTGGRRDIKRSGSCRGETKTWFSADLDNGAFWMCGPDFIFLLANDRGSLGVDLVVSTGAKGSIESSNGDGCPGLVERHEGGRVRRGGVGLQAAGDGTVDIHVLREEAVEIVSAPLRSGCGDRRAGTVLRKLGEQRKDARDTQV